jgi:DNA-binding NarL/FixJ family response regulator
LVEGPGRPIRVIVADDHTMFRQGVKEMLSTAGDIEVVGEAPDGVAAVDLARRVRPDVALLDIEMPLMGAEEAMLRILEIPSPPRIVIVTMHDEPRLVRWFLGRGASAYLVKSASLEELITAVRSAASIEPGAPDEQAIMVIPRDVLEDLDRKADDLSGRELEILLLAARGLSNRQISASLHIAEATVKRHLANVYAKMDVGSRSEATRVAMSNGWISARELIREDG